MQRGSRPIRSADIHIERPSGVERGSRPDGSREIHVDALIARLAASQRGLVERGELLRAQVTRHEIRRRLDSGHLHSIHRGVYAVGHPTLSPLARSQAALLAIGPHAALSHRTAAAAWRLLPDGNGPIHVTHNPPHRRGPQGVVLHRSSLPSTEVRLCHGLPTTSPARTLVDLAGTHPDELARALNEALVRRLVHPAEIHPRGRGAAGLRTLLASGPAPTRSEAERRLLRLLRRAGLPRPRTTPGCTATRSMPYGRNSA